MLTTAGECLAGIAHELTLFAAIAFLVGGTSDTIIDAVWMIRAAWRRQIVFRRFDRADATTLTAPDTPGRIAIFVPAWDESAVIAAMLRHTVATLGAGDWVVYVGLYPNDPATADAVAAISESRVRIVTGTSAGPTTKADCLNSLWQAMCADEAREGAPIKAIVLHDAEDVVHPAEVRVFDTLIERFDLVQLPVVPLVDGGSGLMCNHYRS